MAMSILCTALAGAALLSSATAQGILSLTPQSSPPSGASGDINPSFAGFGIEPSNLFSFMGYDTTNQFTINLLENLANFTGAPPHIRLGGNTQDYLYYSESQTQWTWINNPNSHPYASDSMLIGPRFFEVANRLPRNTPITYGLNMAYQGSDYVDQITTMAQKAISGFTNLNLVSLEIGNEPDLYGQNGLRTGTWGGRDYVPQWLDRAYWVYEKVLKPAGLPTNFFESAQTASTIGTSFEITQLVNFGIEKDSNSSGSAYLSSWNQHDYYYYIGVSTYALTLDLFMTLSTTKDQFAAWVKQVQQSQATPYPYALREMGIVGPIGLGGITDTFGAALWQLNFLFYTAGLNISSVQMHMTDNSNASAWNPMDVYGREPFVRPNYYGIAAFDQIIGPSCQARVYNEPITAPSGYSGKMEVWSVYQTSKLSTIVVINSMMANVSTVKNSVTVQLSLPTEFAGQKLYLAYLTNTGADAMYNTTWNGMSFEQSGNGNPTIVSNTVQYVTIGSDGSASVTVRDSEAVACQIGTPVGQIDANQSACSAMTASSKTKAASSSTSSSAANSITGSSARASPTNGVLRISSMVLLTTTSSFITGAFILFA